MGIYIFNILKHLDTYKLKNNLTILYNKDCSNNDILYLKSKFNKEKVKFIKSPFGFIITEQFIIPILMILNKYTYVLCSGDTAPFFVNKNKIILLLHDLYYYHGQEIYKKSNINIRKRIGLFYRRFCIRRFFNKHDVKVITVSKLIKEQLLTYDISSEKFIQIIPNGVDFNFINQRSNLENKNNDLVLITGLDPQKNFIRFAESIDLLDNYIINKIGKIIVIGINNYDLQSKYIDKYVFKGYLYHSNVIQILSESRYFVLPSLFESFGIPGIEALSANCLVAASSTGALPDILKNNAVYFDPYDVSNMSNVIKNLIETNDVQNEIYLTTRTSLLLEYEWTSVSLKFLDYINKL
jgi:glycosyltransferase involved in cell wall biosynthesis